MVEPLDAVPGEAGGEHCGVRPAERQPGRRPDVACHAEPAEDLQGAGVDLLAPGRGTARCGARFEQYAPAAAGAQLVGECQPDGSAAGGDGVGLDVRAVAHAGVSSGRAAVRTAGWLGTRAVVTAPTTAGTLEGQNRASREGMRDGA